MKAIDIILVATLIPAIISGLSKGFMEQAVGLITVFLSIYLAWQFHAGVSAWVAETFKVDMRIADVAGFVIVFICVSLLGSILGKILSKFMEIILLGWLDKLLGLALALITWACVTSIIIILFDCLNTQFEFFSKEYFTDSALYCRLKEFGNFIFPYMKSFVTNV